MNANFLFFLAVFMIFAVTYCNLVAAEPTLDRGYRAPGKTPPAELWYSGPKVSEDTLPSQIDFGPDMPPVVNQNPEGGQDMVGSCVAWACGYYAYGFLKAEEQGWTSSYTPETTFAAMMLYWLCTRGENISWTIGVDPDPANAEYSALTWLYRKGICTVAQWGNLWPEWYTRIATTADLINAENYKTQSPGREYLFVPGADKVLAVKAQLAERKPVIIGFDWEHVSNPENPSGPYYMYESGSSTSDGGHALCLVGYDDGHAGVGAFKAIDSSGPGYGDNGFVWLSYALMSEGINEAWIIKDCPVQPPTLTEAEYFIGPFQHSLADVEADATTTFTFNGILDNRVEQVQAELNTGNTAVFPHPGLYTGGVRFRSINGEWSIARRFEVRIDSPDPVTVVAAEVYIDEDPGQGAGIPILLGTEAPRVGITDALSLAGVIPGLHRLNIRVQDANGLWSIPRSAAFEIQTPGLINIVAAEWTTKSESEPGEGSPMEPTDGEFDTPLEDVQAIDVVPDWASGDNRVIVRVQDSTGRWAEDFVEDNEPPVALCKNTTVFLDQEGSVQISENDIDGGSTDNLLITNREVTPTSFTCADLGPKTVLLTIFDFGGNVDTCEAIVTVEDNLDPVITVCPPDQTLEADESCQAEIPDLSEALSVSDNCPGWSIIQFPSAGTRVGLGNHPVTIAVSDTSGNENSCSTTIHVVDGHPPVVTLNGNALVTLSCCEEYVEAGATASDNCDGDLTDAIATGGDAVIISDPGTYVITYTVSDAAGKTAMKSRTVVVLDDCPAFAGIPADKNMDWRITISEAIGYLNGWQQGANPIALAIRAAYIWQNGEYYNLDCTLTTPLSWYVTPSGGQGGPCTYCE